LAQRSPTRPPASGIGFPALVGVAGFDSWPGSGGRLPLEQELETMGFMEDHFIIVKVGGESETDHAAKLDGPDPRHVPEICLTCRNIDAERKRVEA